MKNLLIITALLILPFKFFAAEPQPNYNDLDLSKIHENWDSVKAQFVSHISKIFQGDKYSRLRSRVMNTTFLFEINDFKTIGITDEAIISKYDSIRKDFLDTLMADYKKQTVQPTKKTQSDTLSPKTQKTSPIPSNPQDNGNSIWFWIVIGVAAIELLLILLLISKIHNANIKRNASREHYKTEINRLKGENSDLKLQNSNLKNQEPKVIEKTVEKIVYKEAEAQPKKSTVTKYLCCLTEDGNFGRIDETFDEFDSYYYIKVPADIDLHDSSLKIQFAFHGDSERAIQNWSSVLSPAADFEGSYKTSKNIKTETPGVIQYDSANERWKVTQKAKLKLY